MTEQFPIDAVFPYAALEAFFVTLVCVLLVVQLALCAGRLVRWWLYRRGTRGAQ